MHDITAFFHTISSAKMHQNPSWLGYALFFAVMGWSYWNGLYSSTSVVMFTDMGIEFLAC